jgi:shikimate kinase
MVGDVMLDLLRAEIDACDKILTETLTRRLMAAARIAAYKKEHSLALYQPEREAVILNKIAENLESTPYAKHIQDFYRCIFRLSRGIQMKEVFPHNIVLIGFMGSGKTTVGQYLADLSGYTYYDVDTIIEQQAGKSVSEIFSRYGEAAFRALERQTIDSVSNNENAVISCGGGCILDENNIIHLKQKGKLVWLMAEAETLYERIKYQGTRPLALHKTFEEIQDMVEKRRPLYSGAADYRISVDGKPVSDIVDVIIGMVMRQL